MYRIVNIRILHLFFPAETNQFPLWQLGPLVREKDGMFYPEYAIYRMCRNGAAPPPRPSADWTETERAAAAIRSQAGWSSTTSRSPVAW
jgi:hypothetical protein